MATGGELGAVHHLGQKDKFGNVSIALQFSKRRPLQTRELTTAALKARSKTAPKAGKRRLYNFDQFAACLSYESEDDKEILKEDAKMSDYEFEVRQMAKYLKVYGMYQSKINHEYATYSADVNKDVFDWKAYG